MTNEAPEPTQPAESTESAAEEPGSFAYFGKRLPATADALDGLIDTIYRDCELDAKTRELVFLGIQAALRLPRAIRVHVRRAVDAGATDDEVLWAITLALPNAGMNAVCESVGIAQPLLDELRLAGSRGDEEDEEDEGDEAGRADEGIEEEGNHGNA